MQKDNKEVWQKKEKNSHITHNSHLKFPSRVNLQQLSQIKNFIQNWNTDSSNDLALYDYLIARNPQDDSTRVAQGTPEFGPAFLPLLFSEDLAVPFPCLLPHLKRSADMCCCQNVSQYHEWERKRKGMQSTSLQWIPIIIHFGIH